MRRILCLFVLAGFVLAACGQPIVDKSHENRGNSKVDKALSEDDTK